jgi:GDP-L-fucose synthase
MYSLDAAELLLWALLNYNEDTPIIISTDEEDEISIGDVANMVTDSFELKQKVVVLFIF